MIKNYCKIAFRNLVKNKVFSSINIGGLALGMATTVLLTLWVLNEWRFDGYHRQAKDIYRIKTHMQISDKETWHWASTPWQFANHFNEIAPEIQSATRIMPPYTDLTIKVGGNLMSDKKIAFVDKNWFETFDYVFISGNARDFASDKFNVAITESRAKRFFGNADPIGKILQMDSLTFTVKAVLKDNPSNSSFDFGVLMQTGARLSNPKMQENDNQWGNFSYQTFIVCREGVDINNLSNKLTTSLRKFREDTTQKCTLDVQPFLGVHFDESIKDNELAELGDRSVLGIFSIIAFFILLIACINYVNLTTARASQRMKEVSVKKMIGATKTALFQQFFTESILTSSIAALLALILINIGLPFLSKITDNHFSLTDNPIIWVILGGITLLSIGLTGIYPSLVLSAFQPIKMLKGIHVGGTKKATFRKGLVVFQFTFTIVLLIATFLIYKQLQFMQSQQLGYDREHIFTFSIPWSIKNGKEIQTRMANKLKTESSILDVTNSNSDLVDVKNMHSGSLNWTGKDQNWKPTATLLSITPNYPQFYDLKLTEGRWFEEGNLSDVNNVILNETAIREYNIPKPVIGQYFELHGRKGQIVGIAKDFHFRSVREKITPLVLFSSKTWLGTISIKTAPNQTAKAIASAERIWREMIPEVAFKYAFVDETYEKLHRKELRQLTLFNAFALVVLLISCFGLFGLATFAAEVRIKEIGVRKILGASVGSIVHLLSKDFLKLILIAFIVASPIAWWATHKWLENFAYHINIDWWVFPIAGFITLFIALLTVSFQAVKAAVVNPVKSLRTE
jgi:putative ABC transport system permease protein